MCEMSLNSDSSAVEGLPLKLIITALVLSITIPASVNALQAYDRIQAEEGVQAEVEHLALSARQVYLGGSGSQRVVQFNPKGGMFYTLEWVAIGGPVGSQNTSSIFYRFEGGSTRGIVLTNPQIPVQGEDGNAVMLGPGNHELLLRCRQQDSGIHIEIKVIG